MLGQTPPLNLELEVRYLLRDHRLDKTSCCWSYPPLHDTRMTRRPNPLHLGTNKIRVLLFSIGRNDKILSRCIPSRLPVEGFRERR